MTRQNQTNSNKDYNTPNIILILADDMGYGDLSCLNEDSKIETPNMDKLAQKGIVLTDAHAASSVCTPSRYSILTGRYCWRSRLQKGVLGPFDPPLIEKDRLTLPELLKEEGYNTSVVGKWHLGMEWPLKDNITREEFNELIASIEGWSRQDLAQYIDFNKPLVYGPLNYGFDYYFGVDVPNFPPYCYLESDYTVGIPSFDKPEEIYGHPGPMLPKWDLSQIMPDLTEKAVDCIDNYSDDKQPFFLYFPLTAPHTPIAPANEFKGKSGAGDYGDFVYQVDHTVGEVMTVLQKNGIEDNTLLIVTSDNGSPGRKSSNAEPTTVCQEYGHNPSYIYRGIKSDTWDGGHRIPFIASWPEQIEPGTKSDETISLIDIMATTASIIGKDILDDFAEDSYDILPVLTVEDVKEPIREATVHHGGNGLFGIRKGPWKLILGTGSGGFSPDPEVTPDTPPGQLYNLNTDIEEQNNLYNEYPEIVAKLTNLLESYKKSGRSR